MYRHIFKPFLDTVLSALALVVLSIPMLLIALMVKIDSRGPVLFKQKRIGKGRTTFMVLKYRSMPTDAPHDTPTHEFKAEDMLTPFQRFIRRSSLDELPQLINIITQKMSLVGPRPALWNQDDLIAERDKYGANDVKPGLTGWAQVHGRDELEIAEKARLDGKYAETLRKGGFRAFAMDCKCLWLTVTAVLRHDGVVEGGTGSLNCIRNENAGEGE